jgi:hypothetical protein
LEGVVLKVFISYYTSGSAEQASSLKERIKKEFPLAKVFLSLDPNSKKQGVDWDRELFTELHQSNTFVALIDSNWVYRIHTPGSIVRRELETALWNPHIRAHFPIRLDNVSIPKESDLPPSVRDFLRKEFFQDGVGATADFDKQCNQLLTRLTGLEAELMKLNQLPLTFISSPLALRTTNDSLAFFSLLVTEIVHQAQRENRLPMPVIVKIPEMETVENAEIEQKRILDGVLTEADSYRAIVIAPFQAAGLQSYVDRFRKEHARYPLFTIDQCFGTKPWTTEYDEAARARDLIPGGVMCDWGQGGSRAADLLNDYFVEVGVREPTVWLLTGTPGMEDREEGFERRLKELNPLAKTLHLTAKFQQDRARDLFLENAKKLDYLPHGVFCTNDEMALGVRDALEEIKLHPEKRSERFKEVTDPTFGIKIVGFDAIHDFTTHISPREDPTVRHPHFLNTINVRLREQARQLIDLIVEYIRNPKDDKLAYRVKWVMPTEFVPLNTQKARVLTELKEWEAKEVTKKQLAAYTSSKNATLENQPVDLPPTE